MLPLEASPHGLEMEQAFIFKVLSEWLAACLKMAGTIKAFNYLVPGDVSGSARREPRETSCLSPQSSSVMVARWLLPLQASCPQATTL